MIAQVASTFWMRLGPAWLAGPIFDKELRVASRRRRPYVLRFAYVGLLAIGLLYLWCATVRFQGTGTPVVQVSRLGEFGKQIVLVVIWFQFIAGQLLAAVLLSDAIGSEIRRRTLDVLLVTPIRSFQIVMGKLLSTLLQAASLWAISLPILAVVRVFGGVPWDSVVAGLCVTFSAGLFTGALSLCLSISSRHPYSAALQVATCYVVIWSIVPAVGAALSLQGHPYVAPILSILRLANPFMAMGALTRGMLWSSGGPGSLHSWPWHCLILLSSTAVVVALSVWRLRGVVRRVPTLRVDKESEEASTGGRRAQRPIRPVTGSAVAWKERRASLFRKRWAGVLWVCMLAAIAGIPLGMKYFAGGAAYFVLFPVASILQFIFVISLAVTAASAVTKEREARTWPILLTTPLDGAEIIKGKAWGVFQRNLPLLLPSLVVYSFLLLFAVLDQGTGLGLVSSMLLLIVGLGSTSFFLLGTGLYCSTRLRTTTAAVVATLAAYYVPKVFCGFFSPLFLLSTQMVSTRAGRTGHAMPWLMWLTAIVPAAVYVGVGLLFMRLAIGRVRRDIF